MIIPNKILIILRKNKTWANNVFKKWLNYCFTKS